MQKHAPCKINQQKSKDLLKKGLFFKNSIFMIKYQRHFYKLHFSKTISLKYTHLEIILRV